jgi:integrase/recombinase XerD
MSNESLQTLLKSWLEEQTRKGKAKLTLNGYKIHVTLFIRWCDERGIEQVTEISKAILENYARYLSKAPLGKKGEPLQANSQQARLIPVRLFFNWLSEKRVLVYNPAKDLILHLT